MKSNRTLINSDSLAWLVDQEPQSFDCVIADPPDNLGLGYADFTDKLPPRDYEKFLVNLIRWGALVGKQFWLSYYHKHQPTVMSVLRTMMQENSNLQWHQYIWRFTFGQYMDSDCANGYRPILRISFTGAPLTTGGIMVPSERALMGDKRTANPTRVPDDVWEFPRIVGNSHERRSWHPTQHPEGLYQRMIRLSTPIAADRPSVVDLFGGTGTLFRAVKGLDNVDATIVERSVHYCNCIYHEHATPWEAL